MSALQVFVVAIAALCLSTAEFAISAVLLWGKRTDLSHRWQLLFQPVLSAVLIILATLLFLYTGNEAAVPILLVSVISVGGICQVSHLSAWSTLWVIGPTFVCFVIDLGLSVATGFMPNTELQKTIDYAILSFFLVEYFQMVLVYLIIYRQREQPLSSDPDLAKKAIADLLWNIAVCFIITVTTSFSLALYSHCIIDRTATYL
ncbi:hypothetical protein V501_09196, partial [Pseudogymnoascus sp. VKM F-4519 (FW-2642)]